ncbi:MAG: sn-glycerol-3-phosphate ABC transporter substrate-binding lipoprotein UgpB [Candidatus Hydrogenedentota bacterium]
MARSLVASAAGIVLGCLGCGAPATTPGTAQSGAAYRPIDPHAALFWDRNTLETADLLNLVVKAYNEKNPRALPIKMEYIGDYKDIFRKATLSIQARELPAAAVGYESMTAEYIAAGAALDLEPYIRDPEIGLTEDELADFYPGVIETNRFPQFDGKMYSFPYSKSVLMMYFNKRVLGAAGISDPPRTWEEFLDQCRQFKARTGKPAYAIAVDCSTVDGFIYSMGGEIVSGNETRFDSPETLRVFQLYATLVKEGLAYQVQPGTFDDREDFAHDRAAFFFRPSSHRAYTEVLMGGANDAWGMATIPQANPDLPRTVLYGPNICIFRTTDEHQRAAWNFVKHFTSTEISVRWALASGYLPIRKSAASNPELQAFWSKWPYYRAPFDCLEFARPEPNLIGWQEVRTLVERALTSVLSGMKSPEQATADLKRDADKVLASP